MFLVYNIGYLIFALLGYFIHPFYYTYHLLDIIVRSTYLQNVLKAIYRPRYELLYTMLLFVVLEYIFAMIAYIWLDSDFEKGECNSLAQCFMVIVDQTFKNDGGIGSFMERAYPDDMKDTAAVINYPRFAYDNLFNIILCLLVIEIISGIIIDTFGALREEHNIITDSIENKCMICGKDREYIEKEHADNLEEGKVVDEKAFEKHKENQHNIYHYVFFLAYLKQKPELEYTGLESYVFEKSEEKNNQWFPIYKIGSHSNDSDDSDESGEENEERPKNSNNGDY